jgi:ubiquinone/menaquinone biosynthesis C-methylase UbiE
MELVPRITLIIAGVSILWQITVRIVKRLYHSPAPAFIGYALDSDMRRRLQPSDKLIERSGIREGMSVLEVGCGSGAFTTFVARAVGEQGEVTALDIQPAMLEQLERKLKKPENQDVQNIRLYEGGAYELPFEPLSLDLVYMVTVLPEIPDQGRALAEVKRVLKLGGILAVTEFLPDPDYPLSSTTVKRGKKAGFDVEGVYGNLWNYTVRFRKPEQG